MSTLPPDIQSQPACRIEGTLIPSYLFASHEQVARRVAMTIASVIRERNSFGQQAVLALKAGSSMIAVYRELIRMHREDGVDFDQVVVFTVDEYLGLDTDSLQSNRRWLSEQFLDHVNVRPENLHFLDGSGSVEDIEERVQTYETEIEHAGGIDILLLDVGRNGRLGFNEPFSVRHGRTRAARLDPVTRTEAASNFFAEENVPTQGVTMGLGTILSARKILLVTFGEHQASILKEVLEGEITDRVPASYLQEHHDTWVLLDTAAAGKLTAVATPWVLGNVEWSRQRIKQAVLWLTEQTGKALLKLDDNDFRQHNLHQLLRHHGPAQEIAHRVFSQLMQTIEYHPAGREPQRVICFSPHPDDDVISMGGTLIRLVEDGHEVHVAYMTSGNIAVFDRDALRVADLVAEFNRRFAIDTEKSRDLLEQVRRSLVGKSPGDADTANVLEIKSLLRWTEAKAGARMCGCEEDHLHFLNLPFYCTGTIAKKPVSEDDVQIVREFIEQVNPGQVYMAGDLSDPHGTHRMCADCIFQALEDLEQETGKRPETLLYRGAWQEWPVHEIEIAVPMSPRDLDLKKQAIFCHESQKDDALFPGEDPRQFWQRAEDRNRNTADAYNRVGLPEYYAMEGFVRWRGEAL